MIKKNLLLMSVIVVFALSVGMNTWVHHQLPNTAYVDVQKVFEQFSATKELDAKLTYFETRQKNMLDSLGMKLKMQQARINQNTPRAVLAKLETQQQHYRALSREFSEQYDRQDQEYTQMIWQQINGYIKEYGEEKDFDYIYGANGTGTMMYASSEKNITESIIEYINLKYEGI